MAQTSARGGSRRYDNSSRQAQARANRGRIIDAARQLFIEQGYEVTIAQIARKAGVSVPTVQKAFGTKAGLVKAVYDVTLAGDDEPVPMGGRPVFLRLEAETDAHEVLRLFAEIGGDVSSRLGELYPTILAGAMGGDPDLVDLRRTISTETRTGSTQLVDKLIEIGGIRAGLSRDDAIDSLWWLIQPEQYVVLVGQAGWPLERYVAWLNTMLVRLLLADAAPER